MAATASPPAMATRPLRPAVAGEAALRADTEVSPPPHGIAAGLVARGVSMAVLAVATPVAFAGLAACRPRV